MTKAPRLALLLSFLLVACETPPQVPPPLKLDYAALGKINLDVHDINFIDRHTSQVDFPPYAADQFKPSFNKAVHRWVEDRLQAAGSAGDVSVIVRKANLSIESLVTKTGLDVVLERQQDKKYTAHIEVEVEARGNGFASAAAEATRYVTLPEDPSKAEKQAAYNALLAGLMQDLDHNLDMAIHQHLADFIVGSSSPMMMDNSMAPITPAAAEAPMQPSSIPQ